MSRVNEPQKPNSFKHWVAHNERVAKELNELADTIEAGQKAKEEWH